MKSSLRFKPANRLNTSHAFSEVFEKGKRFHLKAGLYIIFPNQLQRVRLGLIIAKKKLTTAVQRNRLKRIQREIFRHKQERWVGYDIVFVANHKVSQLCQSDWFALCRSDWEVLAQRL